MSCSLSVEHIAILGPERTAVCPLSLPSSAPDTHATKWNLMSGSRVRGRRTDGGVSIDATAAGGGRLAMAVTVGEHAEQLEAGLVPHDAGKGSAAPQVAPRPAATGATSARSGGLVGGQNGSQSGDGVGVVTGLFQLCELVPYRADRCMGEGVGVPGQPGHGSLR
jgi:hypothetical protein